MFWCHLPLMMEANYCEQRQTRRLKIPKIEGLKGLGKEWSIEMPVRRQESRPLLQRYNVIGSRRCLRRDLRPSELQGDLGYQFY